MAFPDWRTTTSVAGGDMLVDRVQLVARGRYQFQSPPNRADLTASLVRGRTPFDGRLPRGFQWVQEGQGRIALRTSSNEFGWLLDVHVMLAEPTSGSPNDVSVIATINVNPTRIRALRPDADASQMTV